MAETRTAMRIATRPATPEDFDYCAKLYFAAMDATIRQLNLDMRGHIAGFRKRWDALDALKDAFGSFLATEVQRLTGQFPESPRIAIHAVARSWIPTGIQTVASDRGAQVRSSDSLLNRDCPCFSKIGTVPI